MKRTAILVAVTLLFAAIVVPRVSPVNHPWGNPSASPLRADGNPLPPPIPPRGGPGELAGGNDLQLLVADGNPLPPPLPPKARGTGA